MTFHDALLSRVLFLRGLVLLDKLLRRRGKALLREGAPGFAAPIAVVALLAAAMILARRQ